MVWKQDLAKLKQTLKTQPEAAPPPPPKAAPKPEPARSIEEEDALFLSMMGRNAPRAPKAKPLAESPVPPPPMPEPEADFLEAMKGLKDVKPVGKGGDPTLPAAPKVEKKILAQDPAPERVHEAAPLADPPAAPEAAAPLPDVAATATSGPDLIHLAAGMAIEVDAFLDLRGHARQDALERLKERVEDGLFLGWRTLHVHLGPSDDLKDLLQDFLQTPPAQSLGRYAQAPVPMGGTQAWILYYVAPASH